MKTDSREVKLFGLVGNLEMSPTSQMGQLAGVGEEADPRRTKGPMGTAAMRTCLALLVSHPISLHKCPQPLTHISMS